MTSKINAIHVHMEGFTAFFRYTFTVTGAQITTPCPSYSSLLGLISACANRTITPKDTQIGFEFRHASEEIEIERTDRLALKGKYLKPQSKGQGILNRVIHFKPHLDLYLTNLDLYHAFTNPAAPPCLGRSQDLCWITKVEQVELTPVTSGNVGSTMISNRVVKADNKNNIPSFIIRCAEWFNNDVTGKVRKVGAVGYYQALPPSDNNDDLRVNVTMNNLYHPSNLENQDDVIYLHEWTKPIVW
jgi:CRISPR-associated Cas5-like protein